ncbi:anti-sigma factor domain-containing protein [Salirhabdus sp. Marseille-P4669]|uniref:anti-sigma factor domain-containing protein n=1 Tax=Salirhabdus sp. Marseille-P4669 TaxID=2042310 RepID=UPI000C7BE3F2|nr:anti-sigma factor domain-containing protein [Salirhabdus sp. Marseille-P4669]
MKKGVVMDKEGSYLIVMSADGNFHKTKKRPKMDPDIGEEIEIKPLTKPFFTWIHSFLNIRNTVVLATVVLLAIIPMLYFSQPNSTAYAYVNIDINPSVELTVNDDLEVIKLTALNNDGKNIISQLNIKDWEYESVEKVTFLIIDTTKKAGFMQDDQDILVGVSYVDTKQKDKVITDKISAYVSQQVQDISEGLTTFEVPKTVYEKAANESMSMNFVYAQELIMQQEEAEEQSNQQATVTNENKVQGNTGNTPQTSGKVEKAEENVERKLDKGVEKAIINNFIEKVNEEDIQLPPGLVKKIKEYQNLDEEELKEQIDEILDKHDEKPQEVKENNYPSETNPSNNDDEFVPPGQQKKNDDHIPPGLEKKDDEESFLPPGLKNKLENVELDEEELLNKAEELSDELLKDDALKKYLPYYK